MSKKEKIVPITSEATEKEQPKSINKQYNRKSEKKQFTSHRKF